MEMDRIQVFRINEGEGVDKITEHRISMLSLNTACKNLF